MISFLNAFLALALVLGSPSMALAATEDADDVSVQEALLRAKPAVVLVITEVASEVTLDCGGGATTVKPPAFRETGTGWFIDGSGWVITNGHVVYPAHEQPRWLRHEQAQAAVNTACLPDALKRAGIAPGERPDIEDAIKRRVQDTALPTAKVTLHPHVKVLVSNGTHEPLDL